MTERTERTARAVVDRCGETYAEQAGIRLRNSPAALYQLLVLSHLLSARISAGVAVSAARALFDAGLRDPRRMADVTWQQRVDALGVGHYRRYDERTATQLGNEARLLLERYGGDLRRLRDEGDAEESLRQFPGIGPVGVDIFLREAQAVWPEYAPRVDQRVRSGAERVGLPRSPGTLSGLVSEEELPHLAAGLVRVSLNRGLADEVRATARGSAG
ncbi:endonuclease [Streptomyces hainanensis]|uniref:Endonuclease n=1 Tax=Streptomyces hainanensis TaxID=402648 RepID=A0A4R4TMC6_9ACTN|nr:endonuclease [Streptomyces hainanensis]TDC76984.1 endonuclease [Streptomyces hainanensis]